MKSNGKMCKQQPPNKKKQCLSMSSPEKVGRIKHKVTTETRKKIPLLGKCMDQFHDLNPIMKSMVVVTFVLWKLYIAYYLYGIVSVKGHFGLGSGSDFGGATAGVGVGAGVASKIINVMGAPALANVPVPVVPIPISVEDPDADDVDTDEDTNAEKAAAAAITKDDDTEPIKVLHIVTALAEYNNGNRGTQRGEDRLQKVFIYPSRIKLSLIFWPS